MNKLTISIIGCVFLLIVAIAGLFKVKFEISDLQRDLLKTEEEIKRESQNLRILKAEWSYLNRPERVKFLSEKYLKLKPVTAKQLQGEIMLKEDIHQKDETLNQSIINSEKMITKAK